MISFDVLFLLATGSLLIYLYFTWNFNYWKKRGIPCDDKLSILFGSLADAMLGKTPLGKIYTGLYEKFHGEKVVGYFKFRQPALLIRDPEIIKKVLVSDFNSFLNNDVSLDPNVDPIMGRNTFFSKDDLWKRGRALVTPAFTAGKIKSMYPQMRKVSQELVKYLKRNPGEIHVKAVMSRYTSEVIAQCAFGIEGNNFNLSQSEMYEMGQLVWAPTLTNNVKMTAFFVAPTFAKLLRLKMVPKKVVGFFNSILRDVIVHRQEKGGQRNDPVQYYIDVKKKAKEVVEGRVQSDIITKVFTDDDILSGCIVLFVESFETTSLTINNVLHQLALHQDVQELLRAEIDEVLKEGELTFEKLNSLNYLHSVYAETNRLLPVVFTMQKNCTETYKMDIGKKEPLVIEKGTPVSLPVYAIHRDPAYWDEPDKFKPERFSDKESESVAKSKGIYMPFSDGPRMCPGSRLATTMVKLALVDILSQFEVHPTDKCPEEIELDPNYFLIAHKGGIHLRFVERSH